MIVRLTLVCFALLVSAQCIADVVLPGNDFVPGWRKSQHTLHFTKENLYDYINGGAELFLEFGFEGLFVRHYSRGDNDITLELYRMENAEAALGIYLMKCGEETPLEQIKARNSVDRYQFTVVKSEYFILVNNFSGNEILLPVMVELIKEVVGGIACTDSVRLFKYLPKKDLINGSELLIRGPFALQPIFTFGEGDVLKLGGKVFGVVGDYDAGGEIQTKIIIPYPGKKEAQSAYRNLLENLDTHLTIVAKQEGRFTFKDYRKKFGSVKLRGRVMEITIDLSKEPSRTGKVEKSEESAGTLEQN